MTCPVDINRLVPVERMTAEDAIETRLLRDMLDEATEYVKSFKWCPQIGQRYLAYGLGGVAAVFLFEFETSIQGADHCLWVVVGDLPSAYFVTDRAPDGAGALDVYCELMEDWAQAVENESSLDKVFPVRAAPTKERAAMLRSRIEFIRTRLIPTASELRSMRISPWSPASGT